MVLALEGDSTITSLYGLALVLLPVFLGLVLDLDLVEAALLASRIVFPRRCRGSVFVFILVLVLVVMDPKAESGGC